MSVCEVYKVQIDMEPKCITEDSEIRIYLSAVRDRGKETRKRELQRRKAVIREAKKRRMRRKIFFWKKKLRLLLALASEYAEYIVVQLFRMVISLAVTTFSGVWVLDQVYELRGYHAIGSEIFFIPMVFAVTYWLSGMCLGVRDEAED